MMTMALPHANPVTEILGVYDADGGLRGEMAYAVGKVLRHSSCGLCDITHAGVRRKRSWDALVASLDIPVRLAHRNELTVAEAAATAGAPLPVVLGRGPDDRWRVLLAADRLAALDGSVDAFERALRSALPG